MRAFIFLSSLLLLVSLVTSVTVEELQQYMDRWGNVSPAIEKAKRKDIFEATVTMLPSITTDTPRINKLAGWTQEQIKELSTLIKHPESQKKTPEKPNKKLGVPDSLDWRTNNVLTPIKNQANCGACWAFAAVGMVESFLVQAGVQTLDINLSEQYDLECTPGYGCNGGYIHLGLDKIQKNCPRESQYPYIAPYFYGGGICSARGIDTNVKRNSYYSITDQEMIDLLQKGPVAVSVSASRWMNYGPDSGIIFCSNSDQVNHAVIVVGYTPEAYIVRNSWGVTWGYSGYGYVSRQDGTNCHILDQAHVLSKFQRQYWIFTFLMLVFLALLY